MKTKFSSIVSLRKKDMQECERVIMQNENRIANKQMQIDAIADEVVKLEMPRSGTFYAFKAYDEVKKMLFYRMSVAQSELDELQANKAILQAQYKKCHIEYEKMAFLDKREQENMLQAIKMQEKKVVDESAMMLYNNVDGKVI